MSHFFKTVLILKSSAWWTLTIGLGLWLALVGCSSLPFLTPTVIPATPTTVETGCAIKVGVIYPAQTSGGQKQYQGYELAQEEINAAGGIAGCPLRLVYQDDQNSAAGARAAAQTLIDTEQVMLVIGTYDNDLSLIVADEANKRKTPLILPQANSALLTSLGYEWIFRLPTPSETLVRAPIMNWLDIVLDENAPPALAVLYEASNSSTRAGVANAILDEAKNGGLSVVAFEALSATTTDFLPLIARLQKAGAQILIMSVNSTELAQRWLRQLHAAQFQPLAMIGVGGAFDELEVISDPTANHIMVATQWAEDAKWHAADGETEAEFVQIYTNRFYEPPTRASAATYSSVKLAALALTEALASGPINVRAKTADALRRINLPNTLYGPISFDAAGQNHHQGLLLQIKEGRLVTVFPDDVKADQAIYPMASHLVAASTWPVTDTTQPLTTTLSLSATASAVFHIGITDRINTLNPFQFVQTVEYNLGDLIYDALYEEWPDGTYHLGLAEAVTRSEDGLVYTFTLPADVKFNNGQPLTTEDVAFSLLKHQVFLPDQLQVIDPTTIVATLPHAVNNFASLLVAKYILPKYIWQSISVASDFKNDAPVGSGPFSVTSVEPGRIRLVANPYYWRTPPKVGAIEITTFSNSDTLIQALQNGEVNMINNVAPSAISLLRQTPYVKVIRGPALFVPVDDIIFNVLDPAHCPPGGKCTGHPALRDVRVRRALAYATNKRKIIETTRFGLASPGLTLVPDSAGEWFNRDLVDYPFDIAHANQILDEAGYLDSNNDGLREMPDGEQPLIFKLNYPAHYPAYLYVRTADLLNETWSQLGVHLEIKEMETEALNSFVSSNFEHDIVLWQWDVQLLEPVSVLAVATTNAIAGGYSETGYANPAYDALYAQQKSELDPQKRAEIVRAMQALLLEEVVYLIPTYDQKAFAVRTDMFTGWPFDQKLVAPLHPSLLTTVEPLR